MPVRRAALLALLALLAGAAAGAQDAGVPPPGEEEAAPRPGQTSAPRLDSVLPRRCGICHLDKVPPAIPGIIVFAPPARSAGAGDAGLCYSCHNGIVLDDRRTHWSGRHHPASGKVSCGSCHTPHVRAPNVAPFMRYPKGSYAFCASCHPGRRPGESGEHPAVAQEKGLAQDCGGCHAVHRAQGEGLIRAASAEGLCGPCHGENPSREGRGPGKTTHVVGKAGPTCLGCHRIHRTVGGKMLLDKAAFDGRLCRQCHERNFSVGKDGQNHPLPAGQVGCTSCHRMHNAEKPGARRGLLAVAWAEAETICLRCHAGIAASGEEWNHPLGARVADDERSLGVRLAGAGAYFAPGGKIGCLSCHRSHGGQPGGPQLVASREALCLYCHPEENSLDVERAALGAHPVSVRPRRARIDAAFLKAGGRAGRGGELTCTTCHRAHHARPKTPGLVIEREKYSCLLCHPGEISIASTPHGSARVPGRSAAPGSPGLCRGCHGEHGWRIPLGEAVEGQTAIERLCAACHGDAQQGLAAFGGATNHPVGVTLPPGQGTSGLPLFWGDGRRYRQGVITCATCHDVHRAGAGGRFLRENGFGESRELCLGCHVEQGAVVGTRHDLAKERGSTCGPCHDVHDALAAASWPAARGGGDRAVADLADFCATCHRAQGAAASAVVAERFHPAAGASREKDAKKVGCGGCHDPHRWNPAEPGDRGGREPGDAGTSFLVRSAAGPADLCATCHPAQALVLGTPHDPGSYAPGTLPPPAVPDTRRHGVCAFCHAAHGAQPLAAAPAPANPAARPAPGSDPCESCHAPGKIAARATVGERGHPVGVSPGQDFGPDLPLYGIAGRRQAGGRIACATCHDPHRFSPAGGSGGTSKAATSFLRLGADGFAPLCFPCHAEKSMLVGTDHDLRVTAPAALNREGQNAESSGVCGACHATHNAPAGLALWNREFGDGRDERSRACTGCHRPGNALSARVPPRAEPHLVNFPGRGLVSRRFTITRSTAAAGASNIGIFDESGNRADQGFLSCASCHDVHRWETDVSNSGPGIPLEGDLTNSFLRVRSTALDRTFCAECHGESLAEHYRTYHFPEGK